MEKGSQEARLRVLMSSIPFVLPHLNIHYPSIAYCYNVTRNLFFSLFANKMLLGARNLARGPNRESRQIVRNRF